MSFLLGSLDYTCGEEAPAPAPNRGANPSIFERNYKLPNNIILQL